MNFTREPIVETVITPREGCKLVVRSTRGVNQEDYFVDAVEVVSFGHSFFFRSLDRPKSFLVPVSDYEILELKETRMVLKNVSSERSVKIGGGREAPVRSQPRELPPEEASLEEPFEPSSEQTPSQHEGSDKKRDRRRSRRRRGGGEESRQELPPETEQKTETADASAPAPAPTFISRLFPPPSTLIKDTLSRYKLSEENLPPEEERPAAPDLDVPPPGPGEDTLLDD